MGTCQIELLERRRLLSAAVGTIWGTVYNDANGNGVREATEDGIAGVQVYLDVNNTGSYIAGDPRVTTNGYGTYLFQSIAVGAYKVGEILPGGYRQTNPVGELTATAVAGQISHTGNFGDQQSSGFGTIWGTVFNDVNGNGTREASEPAMPGVRVYLDLNNSGSYQSGDPSSITNSYGTYLFQNIPAGRYVVRQATPAGYSQNTPASGALDVTIVAGQIIHTGNFGNVVASNAPTGTIWGTVYNDTNSSGTRDPNEAGIPGVRVFLDTNGDGIWQSSESSVLTNGYGTYLFRGLPSGTYQIGEVTPAGMRQTSPTNDLQAIAVSGEILNTGNFGIAAAPAAQGLNVTLGTNSLLHGATGSFAIMVSDSRSPAADDIEGMDFTLQIDSGIGSAPAITSVDLLTGTIWAGHNANVDNPIGDSQPQFQALSVTTGSAGDYVTANGLLATVTLSAVGATPGTYALKLTGTLAPAWDTAFLNGTGQAVPATLAVGTLVVN